MLHCTVNEKFEFNFDGKNNDSGLDFISIKDGAFHIIKNNQSYNAEVISANHEEKSFDIKVGNNIYQVSIKDKYDALLEKLGMDDLLAGQVNEIKSPMPGLVFDILAKVGDEVKKEDSVLILEAMKMENTIKSPGDGKIKSIEVSKGDTVEKNQLLISFE